VKVTVSSGDKVRISTASAIDLAGSEDNRRTDNDKERMVESASINKSLFVLAQCVEAIGKKHQRIPYRESKMTRILSLGQNNGLTVMILNLAPIKSYHLDTLSSLNFANRTKKIEVREVENEPMFKGPSRVVARASTTNTQRQPLRPLTASVNVNLTVSTNKDTSKPGDGKPVKAFHVYSDKSHSRNSAQFTRADGPKRSSLSSDFPGAHSNRTGKSTRIAQTSLPSKRQENISTAMIEEMVEKKVEEILAARAVSEQSKQNQVCEMNEQLQKRLEILEQRIEGTEDARAEGLSYLLMGKQHQARGEDFSALKMYQLALPFFPKNEKLATKIATLKERIQRQREQEIPEFTGHATSAHKIGLGSILSIKKQPARAGTKRQAAEYDEDYEEPEETLEHHSDDDLLESCRPKRAKRTRTKSPSTEGPDDDGEPNSPGTLRYPLRLRRGQLQSEVFCSG
jgi:hypothetical protein